MRTIREVVVAAVQLMKERTTLLSEKWTGVVISIPNVVMVNRMSNGFVCHTFWILMICV